MNRQAFAAAEELADTAVSDPTGTRRKVTRTLRRLAPHKTRHARATAFAAVCRAYDEWQQAENPGDLAMDWRLADPEMRHPDVLAETYRELLDDALHDLVEDTVVPARPGAETTHTACK